MLPPSHLQIYREFKSDLEGLKDVLSQNTVDRSHLKSYVAKLQDFFQNQILELDADGLDAGLAHQAQSVQVEIGKQLRLLGMDTLFLQTAQQPTTVAQRLDQARDRLTFLLRYCDMLISAE